MFHILHLENTLQRFSQTSQTIKASLHRRQYTTRRKEIISGYKYFSKNIAGFLNCKAIQLQRKIRRFISYILRNLKNKKSRWINVVRSSE